MSQGIGIYTHLYSLAVQAGFYGDAVECLTATREIRVRSPSGSGPKIFFFTCHNHLNLNGYQPRVVHKLLRIEPQSTRDVNRIATNLKLLCGAYTLQSNRSAYNKTEVNPTCQLCDCGDEDLEHFILKCTYLEYTRNPITSVIEREVDSLLGKSSFEGMCDQKKLDVILDCTVLLEKPNIISYV